MKSTQNYETQLGCETQGGGVGLFVLVFADCICVCSFEPNTGFYKGIAAPPGYTGTQVRLLQQKT